MKKQTSGVLVNVRHAIQELVDRKRVANRKEYIVARRRAGIGLVG